MPAPRVRRLLCGLTALLSACAHSRSADSAPPPRAEFLLSTIDSTFWVATTSGAARVRGAPLVLARYGGHYYELFTADDDFSYDDALLLGERLYRRDIVSGDSTVVFADTTVERVAMAYARAHPDERPLGPNEDGEADPSTSATAEVDILGVLGPFVSYEYHVDIDLPDNRPWHSTRRGVIDLRTGADARVTDVFGAAAALRLTKSGRAAYESSRDSLIRARVGGGRGEPSAADRRAAATIARLQFDERSFSLEAVDGAPAVVFAVPGRGEGAAGNGIALPAVTVDSVAWWPDVRGELAQTDSADEDVDRWDGAGYRVIARYDSTGDIARLTIADSTRREWSLAMVMGPLLRIAWLDSPPPSDTERRALRRAFDQAATYDDKARVADVRSARNLYLVTSHAPHKIRPRKQARDVGAHDARTREQPRTRVRRRDSLHDGQMRRDRRVPA